MTLLDLLMIQVIVCFIVDLSGAQENLLKPIIRRFLHLSSNTSIKIPLLGCSLCTGWWSNLIYLLFTSSFTLTNLTFTALLALLSKNITGLLRYFTELLVFIENQLYKIISDKL